MMQRINKMIAAGTGALLLLACGIGAQGAVITWDSATALSAESDVSTNGTLAIAANPGGGAVTLNTVLFQAANAGGSPIAVSGHTVTNGGYSLTLPYNNQVNAGFWTGANPGGSASYNTALDTARFNPVSPNTSVTNTIGGLTSGNTYEIQVWAVDTRGGTAGRFGLFDNGAGGAGVSLDFDSTNYATGTFVANASTQSFINGPQSGLGFAQLNLIQVRDLGVIPTPSALPAGLALLGLAALRRRRH